MNKQYLPRVENLDKQIECVISIRDNINRLKLLQSESGFISDGVLNECYILSETIDYDFIIDTIKDHRKNYTDK